MLEICLISWVLIGSVGTLIIAKIYDGYISLKGLLFCLFCGSTLGLLLPLMFLHHIASEEGWYDKKIF